MSDNDNDVITAYTADGPAGVWYVVTVKREIWEAWAWGGQDKPPHIIHQAGYRCRLIGTDYKATKRKKK